MFFSFFTLCGVASAIFSASENYFPVSPFHIYMGAEMEKKHLEFICFDNHHRRLFLAFPFSFAHSCIEDGDFVALIKEEEIANIVMLHTKEKVLFLFDVQHFILQNSDCTVDNAPVKLLFAYIFFQAHRLQNSRLWLWRVWMSYDAVTTPNKRSREEGQKSSCYMRNGKEREVCAEGSVYLFNAPFARRPPFPE